MKHIFLILTIFLSLKIFAQEKTMAPTRNDFKTPMDMIDWIVAKENEK